MNDLDRVVVIKSVTQELFTTLDIEERLRRILHVAMKSVQAQGGSILLHDPLQRVLVFRYVVGEDAQKLIGMTIPDETGIAGRVLRTGKPEITEDVSSDPDHNPEVSAAIEKRTLNMLTVPLRTADEKPVGVLQVVNRAEGKFTQEDLALLEVVGDIAALAIRNASLAEEARQALVAHKLSALAHDLKNKAFVMIGWIQTIEPTVDELREVDPDRHMLVEEAFKSVRYSADEIYSEMKLLLDVLRGNIPEAQLEPNSLSEIVSRHLKSMEGAAQRAGIVIESDIMPVPISMLDSHLIGSMVENLIGNAIDATPAGNKVYVNVSCKEGGSFPEGAYLYLEVCDTGKGMPPHKVLEVLEGRATTTKAHGTGGGTRIIRSTILAHKGVWDIQSELGKGTRFKIKIPIRH